MPQPNTHTTTPKPDQIGSAAQRRLLRDLADELNLDPPTYGSLEGLREAIDRLIAIKLSRRTGRPLPDLNDPAAVRKAVDRMTAITGGRPRGAGSYTVRQIAPTPRQEPTAKQLHDRRQRLDRRNDAVYATGRFSESSGYGAHASRVVQQAQALGEHRDAAPLTDPQERLIIGLQAKRPDAGEVAETTEQASAMIDELRTPERAEARAMSTTTLPHTASRRQLGAYTIPDGARILYGERVDGHVRVIDVPANGTGRRYVVERELEQDGYDALKALVTDYIEQADRSGVIPASGAAVDLALG